ncbi:ABC transporter permease subunit [Ilyomonas limi]|uniref:ABC transporter permease subunit n=1 Tax=Ilyomonas limi TaxID=2575867 RepID=A0A4U3KWL7_9BACT|nr:ABC transporter permease/substrate-binding protein [Ilyomonas limi]TKK66975.1 ABC transporter permease subunit [Ilyomonas limi]
MEEQQNLWQFMVQQSDKLWQQTITHIGLTFIALFIAVLVGLPLGILIARKHKWAGVVLGFAGVLQTIPSIALLGFLIPLFGIGAIPAIAALFLYALLPIIRNTYTGIKEVNSAVVDAAKGMGMTNRQILLQVQLPLAMPVILAGIRTATVINVGVATLAAYIAAGGLGEFIFGGIALNNTNMILAGAIPAALLAILFDFLLSLVQRMNIKKLHKSFIFLPFILLLLSSFYIIPATDKSLLAGFEPEFMGREDGYLGLKSKYHLSIRNVVISDAMMYKAVYEKELDIIGGYSTDGRLKAFDLVTLQDDKTIFPPYYAAPFVRNEVLKEYPEVAPVLNLLAGKINDSIMTELNYRVDYLKQLPQKVARDFLVSKGLYKEPQNGRKGVIRLGSKVFGEQYILINMYRMLLEGYTALQVETKTGLGGTKICFDALLHNQIDMYPEYTGTGLLVILQPPKERVAQLISNPDSVYQYVKKAFTEKYNLTWLQSIGFNNTYALMMRRKQAGQLHINTISDLKRYTDGRIVSNR